MKIEFIFGDDDLLKQTYVDDDAFKERMECYPTTDAIKEAEQVGVYYLTGLTDLFVLPNKKLNRTDMPNRDGVIHYGALFKPKPFTMTCRKNENIQKVFRSLFEQRGLFTMNTEHEGITTTSEVASLELADKYSLTLDNPKVLTSGNQLTYLDDQYLFEYADYTWAENTAPFANDERYAQINGASDLFSEFTFDMEYVDDWYIDIDIHIDPMVDTSTLGFSQIDFNGNLAFVNQAFTDEDILRINNDGTIESLFPEPHFVSQFGKGDMQLARPVGNNIQISHYFIAEEHDGPITLYASYTPSIHSSGTGIQIGG